MFALSSFCPWHEAWSLTVLRHNNQDPAKQTWIKRFLDLGGQQYLTTLLMSESGLGATNSSSTARKALALMLKALVRLTYSADIESSMATGSNGLTIPAFLNKLVQEILTSAAREGGHSSSMFQPALFSVPCGD